MSAYECDTEVELKGTFRNAADAVTDPSSITLYVRNPAGTTSTYTYAATEIVRESEGVYTKNVTLDAPGTWYYRFKGEGSLKVAGWTSITVIDGPFV